MQTKDWDDILEGGADNDSMAEQDTIASPAQAAMIISMTQAGFGIMTS